MRESTTSPSVPPADRAAIISPRPDAPTSKTSRAKVGGSSVCVAKPKISAEDDGQGQDRQQPIPDDQRRGAPEVDAGAARGPDKSV